MKLPHDIKITLSFIVLLLGSLVALLSYNITLLTIGALLATAYSISVSGRRVIPLFKASLWVFTGFVLSQAVFYWGFYAGSGATVILWLAKPGSNALIDALTGAKGVAITYQGALWGVISSLKFVLTLFLAYTFSRTVTPRDVVGFVKRLGLSDEVASGAAITFRLLPELTELSRTIYLVSRARRPHGIKRVTKPFSVLKAIIYASVKRAYTTSMALEMKGPIALRSYAEGEKDEATYELAALLAFALLAFLVVW
ncbi:MAG: CbiQ family ECF transporter T component [Nitrososphaeria archaeon]